MRKVIIFLTIFGFIVLSSVAQSAPIVMKGNYIYTQISDDGTLGDSKNYPGIQYDPTGSGNFPGIGGRDFLQPGNPLEVFSIENNEEGVVYNNNYHSTHRDDMTGTLTDLSGSFPYDFYVRWSGSDKNNYFNIILDTYFNKNDKHIMFTTSIFAKKNLTNLRFLRSIDPDQDYNDYGTETTNARGYGSIAPEDWVYASGPTSNWTIGLYSNSSFMHNTGIGGWPWDPDNYLSSIDNGNGDFMIGIAFNLGNLSKNDSVTFRYAYVLGTSPDDAADNIPGALVLTPEPTTMFLFGAVLIGLASYWRKKV